MTNKKTKPFFYSGLVLTLMALGLNDTHAVGALESWDASSRDALPLHVKAWLGTMLLVNICSIFFVKKHVAARWVFGGFLISHFLVVGYLWPQGITVLGGHVAMFHIAFWTPGFIFLILKRNEIRFPKAYAFWAYLSMFYYVGSMIIDIPSALTLLAQG